MNVNNCLRTNQMRIRQKYKSDVSAIEMKTKKVHPITVTIEQLLLEYCLILQLWINSITFYFHKSLGVHG